MGSEIQACCGGEGRRMDVPCLAGDFVRRRWIPSPWAAVPITRGTQVVQTRGVEVVGHSARGAGRGDPESYGGLTGVGQPDNISIHIEASKGSVPLAELHEMFRALSDPTRLAIFQLLRCCPTQLAIDESGGCRRVAGASVGEVCCRVSVAQSTVSHHLKELRQAGLICTDRQGRMVYCRVAPEALEQIRAFAEQVSVHAEARGLLK